jgi:hypothetical protein
LELITCASVKGKKHHSTAQAARRTCKAETALPACFADNASKSKNRHLSKKEILYIAVLYSLS